MRTPCTLGSLSTAEPSPKEPRRDVLNLGCTISVIQIGLANKKDAREIPRNLGARMIRTRDKDRIVLLRSQ